MIFNYTTIDAAGTKSQGTIDAVSVDVAISSLQRRGLTIVTIKAEQKESALDKLTFFGHVTNKDVVILSRQMSTLFSAQISALRVFRLLGSETEKPQLRVVLNTVADDLQGGAQISKALSKHPEVFSDFYVNMVRSGEESGKLDQILLYLADYLDRSFEVTSKAKNALIYPAFVIATFTVVMVLMLTMVIPNISSILKDSGQEVPIYTKIVLGISDIAVHYGIYALIILVVGGFFFYRFARTVDGGMALNRLQISLPYIGTLYKKLYLSRISDNMNTMLLSAIPIVKALEVTGAVVGSAVYQAVLGKILEEVKTGSSLAEAFGRYPEIPTIMVQMVKVGEETGELGNILQNLSKFYTREVTNAVDTLVGLIEPAMIVSLGIGVAVLLASVLIPIYNISAGA
ncbi:MAG: type II secretion system F family protein [bacterium]